jgi:hypothetical protein
MRVSWISRVDTCADLVGTDCISDQPAVDDPAVTSRVTAAVVNHL